MDENVQKELEEMREAFRGLFIEAAELALSLDRCEPGQYPFNVLAMVERWTEFHPCLHGLMSKRPGE